MIRLVHHNGFTLIETMVALSLMTIFLLGVVSFQRFSLHMIQESFEQQKARQRLQELWMLYTFSPTTFSASYQKWKTEKQNHLLQENSMVTETSTEMIIQLIWSSPAPQWQCHATIQQKRSCMELVWLKK